MKIEDFQPPDYYSEEGKARFIEDRDFWYGKKWRNSESRMFSLISPKIIFNKIE